MYYTNISNQELQYFHNLKVHNFTIKLTDVLSSALFKVEEIITGSIFKVYPLFYTTEITSSNSDDRILDNKCIICQKITDTETYLTFISTDGEEIADYSNYADYYNIGDQLNTNQFNSYISLLRHNTIHTDTIRIGELVTGEYGNYHFDIEGSTILDNGIVVTDETITAQPKVKLTDNVFHYSTYTLKLSILHYTGVNILDDITTDNIVIDTLELELTPNTWIDIPLDDIEQGYIIDFDSTIIIKHDKIEIHHINGLQLTATHNTIQTNEHTDITAQLLDTDQSHYDLNDCAGKTIHFYEQLTPTINITATKQIIQSSGTTDISAKVRDADGSIPVDAKVYFYKETAGTVVYTNDGTDTSTLTIDSGVSVTVVNESLEITTSTSGEKTVKYPVDLHSTDNFLFECEIASMGVSQSVAMNVNGGDSTGWWFAYVDADNQFRGAFQGESFTKNATLSAGDKIKIKQENGILMLYHNNNLIYSKTVNLGSDYQIGPYTNKDRKQYIKNIKIWKW